MSTKTCTVSLQPMFFTLYCVLTTAVALGAIAVPGRHFDGEGPEAGRSCYGRGCSSAHGVEVTRLNLMMNSAWNTMTVVCLPPGGSERQLPKGGLRYAVIPLLCCCTRCLLGVLGDWVGRRMNEWAGGCRAAVAFRSPPILMLLCGDG